MTFDSTTFLIFFAGVLLLHQLPISWTARKRNLLIASYVFYASWNPPFVLLIWISTVADRLIADRIDRSDVPRRRRALLIASLAINFGLLGYFKYGGFVLENFTAACHALGVDFHPAAPSIVLPVGISFYTFQTLSYTLDVYFRRTRPCVSFLDFALYVTFFPQLVAGPIVRSNEFLPQCIEPKRVEAGALGFGCALLVFGLFLKVVVADALMAPAADALYGSGASAGFVDAWAGTLAFAVQIYCDFAGYSICAIGIACCLGFRLPINFDSPYAALGFSDFWRRWHITLSSWLRDYLYIPLGGNRGRVSRTRVNLMLTMLLGGLWHGASWTFVVWGALHGGYLLAERALTQRLGHQVFWQTRAGRFAIATVTFVGVCVGWVFFRADTFERAIGIVGAQFGAVHTGAVPILGSADRIIVACGVACVLVCGAASRDRTLAEIVTSTPRWLCATGLALMLVLIVHATGEDRAFIYFQF